MGISSCINKVEDLRLTSLQEQRSSRSYNIQPEIKDLQKKIDSQFTDMKAYIPTVERSVTVLHSGMEHLSRNCKAEFQKLETKNEHIQESLTIMNNDMGRARQTITEMGKTLTVLSEGEDFEKSNKLAKKKTTEEECINILDSNKYIELENEDDDNEVIINTTGSGEAKERSETENLKEPDVEMKNDTTKILKKKRRQSELKKRLQQRILKKQRIMGVM